MNTLDLHEAAERAKCSAEQMRRSEALAKQMPRYSTGVPCRFGHSSERYTSTGVCLACARERSKKAAGLKYKTDPAYRAKVLARNRNRWATDESFREMNRGYKRRYRGAAKPTRECPSSCELCGRKQTRVLNLDHCHESGAFRGWLCNQCNVGLGMLGDSVESMERVLAYLKRSQP